MSCSMRCQRCRSRAYRRSSLGRCSRRWCTRYSHCATSCTSCSPPRRAPAVAVAVTSVLAPVGTRSPKESAGSTLRLSFLGCTRGTVLSCRGSMGPSARVRALAAGRAGSPGRGHVCPAAWSIERRGAKGGTSDCAVTGYLPPASATVTRLASFINKSHVDLPPSGRRAPDDRWTERPQDPEVLTRLDSLSRTLSSGLLRGARLYTGGDLAPIDAILHALPPQDAQVA